MNGRKKKEKERIIIGSDKRRKITNCVQNDTKGTEAA